MHERYSAEGIINVISDTLIDASTESRREPNGASISPLRVAVDAHNLLCDHGGIARYLREILMQFKKLDDISLTLLVHSIILSVPRVRLARALPGLRFRIARRVPADTDVTWHPWNGKFFQSRKPSVVTIHDTTPFDLPADDVRKRESQQQPFRRSAQTASRILTVSEFAATRIVEALGVARSHIVVVPLAAGRAFTPAAATQPVSAGGVQLVDRLRGRPYVLCVSSMEPVKNFDVFYHLWRQAFPEQDLALVATGVDASRYPDAIVVAQIDDTNRLAALYAHALFLAVPSLSESFPLPVVEAMSTGVPVVANRVGGLPEVGGDAVQYVEQPRDVAAWCRHLRLLREDDALRKDLRARGLRRAQQFSWERTTQMTLATLNLAVAAASAADTPP